MNLQKVVDAIYEEQYKQKIISIIDAAKLLNYNIFATGNSFSFTYMIYFYGEQRSYCLKFTSATKSLDMSLERIFPYTQTYNELLESGLKSMDSLIELL